MFARGPRGRGPDALPPVDTFPPDMWAGTPKDGADESKPETLAPEGYVSREEFDKLKAELEEHKKKQAQEATTTRDYAHAGQLNSSIFTQQAMAVEAVRAESVEGDEPDFLSSIMSSVLGTLLTSGLGMVMGKIAATMVSRATAHINALKIDKAAQTVAIDNAKQSLTE